MMSSLAIRSVVHVGRAGVRASAAATAAVVAVHRGVRIARLTTAQRSQASAQIGSSFVFLRRDFASGAVEIHRLGDRLRELVKESCVYSSYPFKDDPAIWGVTLEGDSRLTAYEFGDYKSAKRREIEELLRKYMREPSDPRAEQLKEFTIAVTVAASGTGKTRLLDDAMRMPLGAKPGEREYFDHFLRLSVTFNWNFGGLHAHPLAARMLLQFFCGTHNVCAWRALCHLDAKLVQLFPGKDADTVARNVLDALEALYFDQRGGKLGRTVLLIDEISKVDMPDKSQVECERHVYDSVVGWLNGGMIAGTDKSRRGAVFTGLSAIAPWSARHPDAGRKIVWLPLGTFDLWDKEARDAVAEQAKAIEGWPAGVEIPDRVWHLLAATGGRPRDVSSMLLRLNPLMRLPQPHGAIDLLSTLFVDKPATAVFRRYLLPSMLNIEFVAMTGAEVAITQFGRDVASLALLNADQLATRTSKEVVPSVSLGHAPVVKGSKKSPSHSSSNDSNETLSDAALFDEVKALILSTTFCKLDGGGKDFERVWVLLVHTVLRLQHIVRYTKNDFWPKLECASILGGLARPTGESLNVFAAAKSDEARAGALFGRLHNERVFKVRGSSINRQLQLKREPPTLAWWQSVWTANVVPGERDDIPQGWPVALDVVWRPWTVVYFAETSHESVDFALMVGDAGGTDANAPHVYLFQNQKSGDDDAMVKMVANLQAQLDRLFSADFAATHVWRLAGINSVKQVTLCVAAINLSKGIKLEQLDAPFNIVLFDRDDFRALGGAAFKDTHFFRSLKEESKL